MINYLQPSHKIETIIMCINVINALCEFMTLGITIVNIQHADKSTWFLWCSVNRRNQLHYFQLPPTGSPVTGGQRKPLNVHFHIFCMDTLHMSSQWRPLGPLAAQDAAIRRCPPPTERSNATYRCAMWRLSSTSGCSF
jgi:hypothetical protein